MKIKIKNNSENLIHYLLRKDKERKQKKIQNILTDKI